MKLTWKTLNWPVVWIIIVYIIVIVAAVMINGCATVTINKEIDITVINPNVNIESEIK